MIEPLHVGSDPEQFAIRQRWKIRVLANEDDASTVGYRSRSGNRRGKIKVSEEPREWA